MKHIKHFENYSDFENVKNSIVRPAVAFIENSSIVEYLYDGQPGGGDSNEPVRINLCDIAYWDGSSVKTIAKDKYTTSLGTAIGVVVIPEGMLPADGRARIIGLKPVNKKGNASDSHVGMAWCVTSSGKNTSLTDYDLVPITDNAGSTSTGSNGSGYLPSDKFTGSQSYVDGKAKYSKTSNHIPSPYLGDDKTLNPEYSKAISGYNNALSDFNGLSNTEVLVGLGSNYAAADSAWKYKDAANSNIQWYLPSMGELGFLMPRFNEINSAIESVGGVAVGGAHGFWSSSESSSDYAYYLLTNHGFVDNLYYKTSLYNVRVFGVV